MKIAFVVPYVPNKIRTRSYNLIRHLSKQGHAVHVFVIGSSSHDWTDAVALQAQSTKVMYQWLPVWKSALNCLAALTTRAPLQSVYSWHRTFATQLVNGLHESDPPFDVLHVEHLRGSLYARFVRENFPEIPVIWDSVDSISYLFEQASRNKSSFFGGIITRLELERTRQAEADLIRRFDHVLTTSTRDKEALLNLPSSDENPSPISILTGGVDLEYFYPNPDVQTESATIVFSGKMSYHANIAMAAHLVRDIMPRIWERRPNVKLFIVGKDPSKAIVEFGKTPLVYVTGTVEDIRLYLWRAAAAVAPLVYGAGIQNKILEAMACGTPVVTNSRTLSALHVTPGRDILVGDDPASFADQIIQLLENPGLRLAISKAAVVYVKKNHDWKQIAHQLVEIYKDVQKPRNI